MFYYNDIVLKYKELDLAKCPDISVPKNIFDDMCRCVWCDIAVSPQHIKRIARGGGGGDFYS